MRGGSGTEVENFPRESFPVFPSTRPNNPMDLVRDESLQRAAGVVVTMAISVSSSSHAQ